MSKDFSRWEFKCKCGCGGFELDSDFLEMLQDARSIAGVRFSINSGYRCEAYNASIGGASKSKHLLGMAADIGTLHPGSQGAFRILFGLRDAGFTRFKIYSRHIHVDLGERVGSQENSLMWGEYS